MRLGFLTTRGHPERVFNKPWFAGSEGEEENKRSNLHPRVTQVKQFPNLTLGRNQHTISRNAGQPASVRVTSESAHHVIWKH